MSSSLHRHQYQAFRQLLIKAREDAGITQVQIAERLGRPQSFVSKYERGERRLDFTEFIELADVLNLEIDLFVKAYRARLEPMR
jgi:transcriptional regulator with XRE-family HTH domain